MSFSEDLRLRVTCLLRRTGLSHVPRHVLIVACVIALVLVLVAFWRFWPASAQLATGDHGVTAVSQVGQAATTSILAIDVEGAVESPGLYELPAGSRVGDAIERAGGLSKSAASRGVNLAAKLEDGAQLYVPTKREYASGAYTGSDASDLSAASSTSGSNVSASSTGTADKKSKVNINKASSEELQELSGIGETLAQRIIDYREKNGSYKSVDELQEVSGIGSVRYEAIKDYVCI